MESRYTDILRRKRWYSKEELADANEKIPIVFNQTILVDIHNDNRHDRHGSVLRLDGAKVETI